MKKFSLTHQFAFAAVATVMTSTAALAQVQPPPTPMPAVPVPQVVDSLIRNVGHCQAYESDGGDFSTQGGSILLKCQNPFTFPSGLPGAVGLALSTFGVQVGMPLLQMPTFYMFPAQVTQLPIGTAWGDAYTAYYATDRIVGTTPDGRAIIREVALGLPSGFTTLIGEGLPFGGFPWVSPTIPAGTPIVSYKDYTCPNTLPVVQHSRQVSIQGQIVTVSGDVCASSSGGGGSRKMPFVTE